MLYPFIPLIVIPKLNGYNDIILKQNTIFRGNDCKRISYEQHHKQT